MHRRLLPALALPLLLPLALAHAQVVPVSLPDESTSIVVSIALSSEILDPREFPVAGRNCGAFLSELRDNESFAGRIRASYEPPADIGRCFSLEGKRAQVAVVCCAPRSRP